MAHATALFCTCRGKSYLIMTDSAYSPRLFSDIIGNKDWNVILMTVDSVNDNGDENDDVDGNNCSELLQKLAKITLKLYTVR